MNETSLTSLTVRMAVEAGLQDELQALRGTIDWNDLAGLAGDNECLGQLLIASCYDNDNMQAKRATALLLMRLAIEDGCTQMFETWDVDQGATGFVAPVIDFIEGDFPEALVMFMDQGFPPLQRMGMDGLSAMEVAIEKDQFRIQNTIRSYLARAKAHSALEEMAQESSGPFAGAGP